MTRLLYAALLLAGMLLTFVLGVCAGRALAQPDAPCRPVTPEDFKR